MKSAISVLCGTIFLACIIACGSGPSAPAEKATGKSNNSKPSAAAEPEKMSVEERAKRTEHWRAELEEKALELATKGDAMEARLTEREATYKRRLDAGASDYSTRDEIARLKKEIPQVWKALADVEDKIAAGPPESLFVLEAPAPVAAPTPSQQPSKPSTSHPVYGVGHASAPTGPKTVHVNGYTRKDGTRVAPYTRSSPRR